MNRLYALFVPLLAVTAVAVTPTLAQAEPYWTSNGTVIPVGQVEPVATSGALTIHALGSTIICKLKDSENVVNPVGGGPGTDEVTAFTLTGCSPKPALCPTGTKTEALSLGLPWASELVAGTPITDEFKAMEIKLKCSNGNVLETYAGSLTPVVGNSVLEFGSTSGQLKGLAGGGTATIESQDQLKGPPGDVKVSAEETTLAPHWYSEGTRLAEGTPEIVESKGSLTLQSASGSLKCNVKDQETIENPTGGSAGVDRMTTFELTKCAGKSTSCPPPITFLALGLPWSSKLIAGSPISDLIEHIKLEVKCAGNALGVFEGSLAPATSTIQSVLQFSSASGELHLGPESLSLTGTDHLKGPPGDMKITAEEP